MRTALIVAAWDDKDWTMNDVANHYRTLCHYMNFKSVGEILGKGCGNLSMTKATDYPRKAYELGKSI